MNLIYTEKTKHTTMKKTFKALNTNLSNETIEKFKDIIIFLYVIDDGNITKICNETLCVSRSMYYSWLKTDPVFRKRIEQRKIDLQNKDYTIIDINRS